MEFILTRKGYVLCVGLSIQREKKLCSQLPMSLFVLLEYETLQIVKELVNC